MKQDNEQEDLNSSPVSSGDPEKCSYQDDPRSPAELSLAGCNCVRFGEGNPHWPCKLHTPVSACGVDERDFAAVYAAGDKLYNELRQWLATEHDADSQAALESWRTALTASATSHGEQVRDRLSPCSPPPIAKP